MTLTIDAQGLSPREHERSWLRQMATGHGIEPKLKGDPDAVIGAFCRRLTQWHSEELRKRATVTTTDIKGRQL